MNKNYGRDDLMAVAAFRYSLGRMTYIVSDCADWLCEQWPNIAENARKVIQRELEEAFKQEENGLHHQGKPGVFKVGMVHNQPINTTV